MSARKHATGSRPVPRERGAALIISLIFLVVLTLIGVTAMQGTVLEERMAGNLNDRAVALQAAEATLRAAEQEITSWTSVPISRSSCTAPCEIVWQPGELDPYDPSSTWDTNNVRSVTNLGIAALTNNPPEYYIVQAAVLSPSMMIGTGKTGNLTFVYRITARATDSTGTAQSILQTTYARKF